MARELHADERLAIAETLALHGHIFDRGQLDRLEEIFTPEVVYDLSDPGVGTFEGIEAIRSGALKLGRGNPIAHHVTNVIITGGEDGQATAESKGFMIMADGTVGSVTHLDTLRRHDGRWRISRRVILAQRTPLGVSTSLPRAIAELSPGGSRCRPAARRAAGRPSGRRPASPRRPRPCRRGTSGGAAAGSAAVRGLGRRQAYGAESSAGFQMISHRWPSGSWKYPE